MTRTRKTPEQTAALDAFLAKVEAENRARYAADPAPSPAQVESEAAFLKGWARSKPIIKVGGDGNSFWRCGTRMTKLSPKTVTALVKAGYATLDNGILTMVRS